MPSPSSAEVAVAAVGDFMISRRPTAEEIERTRQLFAGADVVVANIDTVLSSEGTPVPKWANLRGPREAALDLRAMGLDVAVMANNHAMDFRATGMLDTKAAFAEAGVLTVGAGKNLADATQPVAIERNGLTVALLAVACTLPVESPAAEDWPGIAPVRVRYAFEIDDSLSSEQPGSLPSVRSWIDPHDLERVRRDIQDAAARFDAVITIAHWGVPKPWRAPFHPAVLEYQRELGRAMVEAGAVAVIGNHPHELHGIEVINGAPIAYSVGNFWIDTLPLYDWMGREAIILCLRLKRAEVVSVTAEPLMLDGTGLPGRDQSERTIEVLNAQSHPFGVRVDPATHRITAE
jgi:poly-gamma-glutamate capsule biosynthesis protein CapA/YwtB (metallophosphatase superfamily)